MSENQAKDIAAKFRKSPNEEKILIIASALVLLAFLVLNSWPQLFKNWFATGALVGAGGVLILFGLQDSFSEFLTTTRGKRIFLGLACLPFLGMIVNALKSFWYAMMMAGAVGMVYAATRISEREKVLPPAWKEKVVRTAKENSPFSNNPE